MMEDLDGRTDAPESSDGSKGTDNSLKDAMDGVTNKSGGQESGGEEPEKSHAGRPIGERQEDMDRHTAMERADKYFPESGDVHDEKVRQGMDMLGQQHGDRAGASIGERMDDLDLHRREAAVEERMKQREEASSKEGMIDQAKEWRGQGEAYPTTLDELTEKGQEFGLLSDPEADPDSIITHPIDGFGQHTVNYAMENSGGKEVPEHPYYAVEGVEAGSPDEAAKQVHDRLESIGFHDTKLGEKQGAEYQMSRQQEGEREHLRVYAGEKQLDGTYLVPVKAEQQLEDDAEDS
ncbi:MAG: hypothetical protein KKB50_19680 [Planctomycetes bacterium]|nr:hypothetical protein [Planctomycetota bacterium]